MDREIIFLDYTGMSTCTTSRWRRNWTFSMERVRWVMQKSITLDICKNELSWEEILQRVKKHNVSKKWFLTAIIMWNLFIGLSNESVFKHFILDIRFSGSHQPIDVEHFYENLIFSNHCDVNVVYDICIIFNIYVRI